MRGFMVLSESVVLDTLSRRGGGGEGGRGGRVKRPPHLSFDFWMAHIWSLPWSNTTSCLILPSTRFHVWRMTLALYSLHNRISHLFSVFDPACCWYTCSVCKGLCWYWTACNPGSKQQIFWFFLATSLFVRHFPMAIGACYLSWVACHILFLSRRLSPHLFLTLADFGLLTSFSTLKVFLQDFCCISLSNGWANVSVRKF